MLNKNYYMLNNLLKEIQHEKCIVEKEIEENSKKAEMISSCKDENFDLHDELYYSAQNEILYKVRDSFSSEIDSLDKIISKEKPLSKSMVVLHIQEEDRQRIARDLHDISLQSLAHLIHKVELSSLYIDEDAVRAKLELSLVKKELKNIIEEIRNIIFDLRPMSFDDLGLRASVERLFESINEKNRYKIYFEMDDISCENDMVLLTIYRVIKECISNIVRHADADTIHFSCKCVENRVCVIHIQDDGKGIVLDKERMKQDKHYGVSVMKERIELLGGNFRIGAAEDKGTKVEIRIPLFEE